MYDERKILVSVITNIQLEPFLSKYLKMCFEKEAELQAVQLSCEDVYADDKGKIVNADIVVVLLDYEVFFTEKMIDIYSKESNQYESEMLDFCLCLHKEIRKISTALIFWFLFEDYYDKFKYVTGNRYTSVVDRINFGLCALFKEQTIGIDTKSLIAMVGIENAYDSKLKYRWNCPYSLGMIRKIAEEIHKQYKSSMKITPKCLVVDCDNTLWGGILSEDGIDGIKLGTIGIGSIYSNFQRFLLDLHTHGIILAVCSKNDMRDVLEVFETHSGMILKKEHIACFCVNWEKKVDNIVQISKNLNISLSSIVFVDDSEFEVMAVREMLPDVQAFVFERDRIYSDLSCFNLEEVVDTETIKIRNETYRSNQEREQLKMECKNYDDFLTALKMDIKIGRAKESELNRIAELSQRTNKCTNGMRFQLMDLRKKMEEGYSLFTVYLKDRYSDLGLVGAFGIDYKILDFFCISCRALGRNVEDEILKYIKGLREDISFQIKITEQNRWLKRKFELYLLENDKDENNFTS